MILKHYIQDIEKLSNKDRGQYIRSFLDSERIPYKVQAFRSIFVSGENIIVDYPFSNGVSSGKKVLISAHLNKFISSPGANDNSSGVSILLELIINLKQEKIKDKTLRIVFFDREDGCIPALLGSKHYLKEYGLQDIEFMLNADSVGMGDTLIIEGLDKTNPSPHFKKLVHYAIEEGFEVEYFGKPYHGISILNLPLFVSDHTTFLLAGLKNACLVTTDYKKDLAFRKLLINEKWLEVLKVRLQWQFMKKGIISTKWKHYHNKFDTSQFIEEETLQKVFNVIWKIVSGSKGQYGRS